MLPLQLLNSRIKRLLKYWKQKGSSKVKWQIRTNSSQGGIKKRHLSSRRAYNWNENGNNNIEEVLYRSTLNLWSSGVNL